MSNVIDFTALQKPTRYNGRKEIKEVKKGVCEKCGSPSYGDPHHIKPRGAGGGNNKENQIDLCNVCHHKAQEYKISQHELIVLVARRERKTVGQIYEAIGLPIPSELEGGKDAIPSPPDPFELLSLEELLQIVIDSRVKADECQFIQGKAFKVALSKGVKAGYLASQTNISTSQVRVLVKVYEAFPDEASRVCELSWSHHKIAAYTSNPTRWIERAADEAMSTRQMREAVIREEGTEEQKHAALLEEGKEMELAKSVFREVEEVIAHGGEPAQWLKAQLLNLFRETKIA